MLDHFEVWEWFLLVLFVACLCHLRLSPWLILVVFGLAGIFLSAGLRFLAHLSPEGYIDPYSVGGDALLALGAGWAMRAASWLCVVAGLTAALIHIRRKMDAARNTATPSRVPERDALRTWNEKNQSPSRDIRRDSDAAS